MTAYSVPLTGTDGHPTTAREHVRAMTERFGVLDEQTLDDLVLLWRSQANRELRGTGVAVIGDRIIGSGTPPSEPGAVKPLTDHDKVKVDKASGVVHQIQLSPGAIGATVTAHQRPDLRIVSQIER